MKRLVKIFEMIIVAMVIITIGCTIGQCIKISAIRLGANLITIRDILACYFTGMLISTIIVCLVWGFIEKLRRGIK